MTPPKRPGVFSRISAIARISSYFGLNERGFIGLRPVQKVVKRVAGHSGVSSKSLQAFHTFRALAVQPVENLPPRLPFRGYPLKSPPPVPVGLIFSDERRFSLRHPHQIIPRQRFNAHGGRSHIEVWGAKGQPGPVPWPAMFSFRLITSNAQDARIIERGLAAFGSGDKVIHFEIGPVRVGEITPFTPIAAAFGTFPVTLEGLIFDLRRKLQTATIVRFHNRAFDRQFSRLDALAQGSLARTPPPGRRRERLRLWAWTDKPRIARRWCSPTVRDQP